MTQRQLICIGCPMGCQLTATMENGAVTAVAGNTCKRGDSYARKELYLKHISEPTRQLSIP